MARQTLIAHAKAQLTAKRELPPTPVSTQKKARESEVESVDPFSEYINTSSTNSSGALLTPPFSPTAIDKENIPPTPVFEVDQALEKKAHESEVEELALKSPTTFKSTEFVTESDCEGETPPPSPKIESQVEAASIENAVESQVEPAVESQVEAAVEPTYMKNAKFLRNYLIRKTDSRKASHTSYVNGRYLVPLEKRRSFYQEYYNEFTRWLNDTKIPPSLLLTERYNEEYFRFFVDIDYKWTDTPLETLDAIERIHKAVKYILCYMDDTVYDYDLEVRPSTRTRFKLHIVFPQVVLSSSDVLVFAQAVEKGANLYDEPGEFSLKFDHQVYKKGSLRMLGSCKDTELDPEHINETEFFYMPADPDTGKRKTSINNEEFLRHSILLDKETHDRVAQSVESGDGGVCLPKDETFKDDLFVTCKYIRRGASDVDDSRRDMTIECVGNVDPNSPLYEFVARHYGPEMSNGLDKITQMGGVVLITMQTKYCPLAKRAHKGNHSYIQITGNGMRARCYSKKIENEACRKGGEWIRDIPDGVFETLSIKRDPIGDICGESDGDTAVERPKKIRRKSKSKSKSKTEAPEIDDSSALVKNTIRDLYNEDSERFDQPALTEYLNRFLAYIHQNDTYAFRPDSRQSFEIYRKPVVSNKMERFEIKVSPFTVWCKNENRREFSDVVFDTSSKKHPQSTLNLFGGYKAKMFDRKVEAEEIETFLYHLREVICRGNEENYDYYIRWWAWFFQRGRTGVMIILLSELKGTGKNIILELLAEHVIGDKYVAVTDKIDTVVQRFNAIMVEKALIVTNELKDISKSGKESSRVEDILKTLIKDRLTSIEKKGLDVLTVPSTVNFHGTSNYEIPLKVDRDQRRYVFFDVSPHKKGDFKYFDELATFVESHPDEIFTYLNQFDLKGWGPEKNLVQTEYTKRIQKAFVNPVHQFWYDSGYCDAEFDKTPYPKDPIYDQFDGWCKKNRKSTPSDIWFTRQITSMGYEVVKIQKSGDRGRYIRGTINRATKELMGVLDE